MNNQNNPYNQVLPMGKPIIPPPPMPRQRMGSTWQQRFLGGNIGRPLTLQQERCLPNWLIGKSVLFFFIAFIACTLVWGYPMEMRYAIISSLSVLLFFYGSKAAINGAVHEKEKVFLRNVFILGFVARLLWAFYGYFFFNVEYYGQSYGNDADTGWFMDYAKDITAWIQGDIQMSFGELRLSHGSAIDDVAYPIWLSIIYLIVGVENDVVVPFIIKCIVGAYCAKLVYQVAKRHYGEGTARMAALFVALNPNMIYWCGTMFKEAEMMFICCLFINETDKALSYKRISFKALIPGLLAGLTLFFLRAALGVSSFLALFAHIVMASNRVMSFGKKIIAGVLVALTLLVGMGDSLRAKTEDMLNKAQTSEAQDVNMKWRAERKGGNSFAEYAGAAVFAPLIFTIPFPTFNMANEHHVLQMQLSGGNYIKNIFSFFVLFVLIMMLLSGEWRKHVFIIAYTCGYLGVLVLSNFAQSSRFHVPVWPMLMLFAAYGIQLGKSNPRIRRWFTIALAVELITCLAWNWFKLAGRGMV